MCLFINCQFMQLFLSDMCEASNFRKIHSYICITCYLLCVFFDVHLHGVKCAAKSVISSRYDSVSQIDGNAPKEYHLVRTIRSSNFSYICKNSKATDESAIFKSHLDLIINDLTPRRNDKQGKQSTEGFTLFKKFLRSIGLGALHSHEEGENDHDHGEEGEKEHTEEEKKEKSEVRVIFSLIGIEIVFLFSSES